jgi:hypothetical protein
LPEEKNVGFVCIISYHCQKMFASGIANNMSLSCFGRQLLHFARWRMHDNTQVILATCRALIANDIGYAQLTGGRVKVDKALNKFRDEDNVRVFLLSHRAGAQGLTLTRANHVILLEPALEPAIEQQAISRVHRVGQNRPVRVLRFLVQSTIEEEVLHIQEERHRAMLHEIRADPDDGLSNFVDQLVHKEVDVDAEAPTTVAAAVGAEAMLDADAQRLISAVLGV